MNELKPCPFCGSDKISVDLKAECLECGAEGPVHVPDREPDAAGRWNRRVAIPPNDGWYDCVTKAEVDKDKAIAEFVKAMKERSDALVELAVVKADRDHLDKAYKESIAYNQKNINKANPDERALELEVARRKKAEQARDAAMAWADAFSGKAREAVAELRKAVKERDEALANVDKVTEWGAALLADVQGDLEIAEGALWSAWQATGVSSTVQGMTTLDDVIKVHRQNLDEAIEELKKVSKDRDEAWSRYRTGPRDVLDMD